MSGLGVTLSQIDLILPGYKFSQFRFFVFFKAQNLQGRASCEMSIFSKIFSNFNQNGPNNHKI